MLWSVPCNHALVKYIHVMHFVFHAVPNTYACTTLPQKGQLDVSLKRICWPEGPEIAGMRMLFPGMLSLTASPSMILDPVRSLAEAATTAKPAGDLEIYHTIVLAVYIAQSAPPG